MGRQARASRIESVVVTCEHGGNRIPRAYQKLFRPHRALLESHRGWDMGSLELARRFARTLDAPLLCSTTSRLLVELNRSIHHPALFSIATRSCPPDVRNSILERYYWPYRAAVEAAIGERVRRGKCVLHLSVHSFTPVLDGVVRAADIGLLYDPKRSTERQFAERWRERIRAVSDTPNGGARANKLAPTTQGSRYGSTASEVKGPLRVRRNYPYRGSADGFTTYLRTRFPASRYLGIELEVNQRFVVGDRRPWLRLQGTLVRSLVDALADCADRSYHANFGPG